MDDKILLRNNKIAIALHSDKLTKMSEGATLMEIEKDNIGITDFLNSEDACSYISDFQKDSYHFLNRSFLHFTGFDKQHIKDIGLSFLQFIIYKDDVIRYCAIYTCFYQFIMSLPKHQRTQEAAIFQFRIVNFNGDIISMMLYLKIVELDCNGNPACEIGTYTDMSYFKTDSIVSGTKTNNGIISPLDYSKYHTEDVIYSEREIEVLRLKDAGLKDKAIADKMGIEPSTVRTNIRNIKINILKIWTPHQKRDQA